MANPLGNQRAIRATATNGFPIGAVVECAAPPPDGKWLACMAQDELRTDWPELSPRFGVGIFTATARTVTAPVVANVVADNTNFLAIAAAGTSPLQASATGASWSTSATWTAATSPASLIRAGTRFVMAGSGGDLTAPYVSTIDQTAANQVAKANWTATTSGATTTLANGLAYGSTANAGAGRTILIPNAAGTTIYTLDDGATAWSARTTSTSLAKVAGCWTGQKFIVPVNRIYHTSTDGVTWADNYFPSSPVASDATLVVHDCASDGNGTVVVVFSNSYGKIGFLVSKDHGATWREISLYNFTTALQWKPLPNSRLSCANGRFFYCYPDSGVPCSLASSDGLTWSEDTLSGRGKTVSAALDSTSFTYKSGVYCSVATTTSALTLTEDMTKFKAPNFAPSNISFVGFAATHNSTFYMKGKS